jgi:small subunit ribosomal protein S2
MKEHIAISEAKKLGIPTFAMVDTNSDPTKVDFAIPSNDDATMSIDKIMTLVTDAVAQGLAERKIDKDKKKAEKPAEKKAVSADKQAVSADRQEEAPAKKEEEVKAETKAEVKTEAKAEAKAETK